MPAWNADRPVRRREGGSAPCRRFDGRPGGKFAKIDNVIARRRKVIADRWPIDVRLKDIESLIMTSCLWRNMR